MTTISRQTRALIVRDIRLFFADKYRMLFSFLGPLAVAYLICFITDEEKFGTVYGSTKVTLFIMVSAALYIGVFNSLSLICKEMEIVRREYITNMSLVAYITAHTVTQFMLCCIQTAEMMLLYQGFYSLLDSMNYGLPLLLTVFGADLMGMAVSTIVAGPAIANLFAPILIILEMVMGGVLFDLSGFTKKLSVYMISRWGMDSMGSMMDLLSLKTSIEMRKDGEKIIRMFPEVAEKSDYAKEAYEAGMEHISTCLGHLCLITVVTFFFCLIALRWRLRNK